MSGQPIAQSSCCIKLTLTEGDTYGWFLSKAWKESPLESVKKNKSHPLHYHSANHLSSHVGLNISLHFMSPWSGEQSGVSLRSVMMQTTRY